jgi:uncharacterized protein YqjF (DUF2071 family)
VEDGGMLETVARQARVARDASGRPWPLPGGEWAIAETRRDVLLAHWRVDLAGVARQLPPELPVDLFEGEAWLGLTACSLEGLRARGLPPLPGLSSGPQLEIYTYVALDDRPGLWAVSLDRAGQLLVEAAKRAQRMPAYRAAVSAERADGWIDFVAERDGHAFRARYAGRGEPFTAVPGTLDHFLTERYALYTADGGRLYRAELHHAPWQLRHAAVEIGAATLAPLLLEGEPHALFAARQDVLAWPLEEI